MTERRINYVSRSKNRSQKIVPELVVIVMRVVVLVHLMSTLYSRGLMLHDMNSMCTHDDSGGYSLV
jgi:hypothetical protein